LQCLHPTRGGRFLDPPNLFRHEESLSYFGHFFSLHIGLHACLSSPPECRPDPPEGMAPAHQSDHSRPVPSFLTVTSLLPHPSFAAILPRNPHPSVRKTSFFQILERGVLPTVPRRAGTALPYLPERGSPPPFCFFFRLLVLHLDCPCCDFFSQHSLIDSGRDYIHPRNSRYWLTGDF